MRYLARLRALMLFCAFTVPAFPQCFGSGCGGGSGSGIFTAPYAAIITASTSGTFTGAAHKQGTVPVVAGCFNTLVTPNTPLQQVASVPSGASQYTYTRDPITGSITITLGASATVACVITSLAGGQGPQGTAGGSIPYGPLATIPSTCSVGRDLYFATDATAGQNLMGCTSTNVYTVLSGAVGGGSPPAGFGSELQGRLNSTSLQALTGSSISGPNLSIAGDLTAGVHGWLVTTENFINQPALQFSDLGGNSAAFVGESNQIDAITIKLKKGLATGGYSAGLAFWPLGGIQFLPQQAQYACNAATNGLMWTRPAYPISSRFACRSRTIATAWSRSPPRRDASARGSRRMSLGRELADGFFLQMVLFARNPALLSRG